MNNVIMNCPGLSALNNENAPGTWQAKSLRSNSSNTYNIHLKLVHLLQDEVGLTQTDIDEVPIDATDHFLGVTGPWQTTCVNQVGTI